MNYLETLRVGWLIYWRWLVLVGTLWILSGVLGVYILGALLSTDIPAWVFEIVLPLIIVFAVPLALSPLIAQMALYKGNRGFDLKIVRDSSNSDGDLSYSEAARVAWLLGWRVMVGVAVYRSLASSMLAIPTTDSVLHDGSNARSMDYPIYVNVGMNGLIIFGLLPLGVRSMLTRRFRGFNIRTNRDAEGSCSEFAK